MADELRRLEELTPRECLRLLGTISLGRIVFTARAMPAVRLVSHLVDEDRVIVRADSGAAITSVLRAGTVVAYQADAMDPAERIGWSTTVLGLAHQVTDRGAAAAFRQTLNHWGGDADDQVLSIKPEVMTGFRLVPAVPPATVRGRR
jgi:hypothetical protein